MEQLNVMDDVHRAAQQVTKARRLSKNGVRVTAAESSSSSLLDHVVKTHAAEAILPETAIPAWAQAFTDEINEMRQEIRAVYIRNFNSDVKSIFEKLREIPKLRAGMGPDAEGIVNPQVVAVGTTPTQAGFGDLWPRTKVDIGTLTHAHLDCLCWFYNEPFDGANIKARRNAFEIFVCGY